NLLRNQGVSSPNPDHRTINITAKAAGAADVQVRFHYYQASFEYYWEVDNVKVTYAAPGACSAIVCAGAAPGPPPVPDSLRASRAAADGSSLALTWDVATCVSGTYKALYGNLASVASGAPSGAACGLGSSGAATWSAVPPGNLWFVVVASDGAGTEGTW